MNLSPHIQNTVMYTRNRNQDARCSKQREENAPTVRHFNGIRYVNGASPEARSNQRKDLCLPGHPDLCFCFHLPYSTTATIYPIPSPRPPLDSKKLQLHKLTLHTNTENGRLTRGNCPARRKEREVGERALAKV